MKNLIKMMNKLK